MTAEERAWREAEPEAAAAEDARTIPDPDPFYDATTTVRQEPVRAPASQPASAAHRAACSDSEIARTAGECRTPRLSTA
jgi:hypothetical protein